MKSTQKIGVRLKGLWRVGLPLLALAGAASGQTPAGMVRPVETADLASTFSQQAARTTTETAPFAYSVAHPGELTLLYNASRLGKIEPCGCRALNLGGIDREAAMVQTIRHGNPQTLYMDAGGYFREFSDPPSRLQTWFMLKALKSLDCQVMNVGFPDLQQGMGSLQYFRKKFGLPLVSANIVDGATRRPVFDAYRDFQYTLGDGNVIRVAVVGITAPSRDVSRGTGGAGREKDPGSESGASAIEEPVKRGRWMIAETNGHVPWVPFDVHTMPAAPGDGNGGAAPQGAAGGQLPLPVRFATDDSAALTSETLSPYKVLNGVERAAEVGRELRPKTDVLVLLAYMSFDRAVKMAGELRDYDVIIAADYIDRMHSARPVADGPLVVSGDHEGKYLGIIEVPRLGQDGRLRVEAENADMLPVLQTIEPLPQFSRFIDQFAELTKVLPVEETPGLSEKIYAGASSCRACHPAEFEQWKTHKHSRAMKTLVDRHMQYNPDCLQCHTVAYRQPGGFTDLRVTAYLANVQCEVCHGPGQAHVQEMRAAELLQREGKPVPPMENEMRMEWNREFCMQCHDPKNDPHFNFNEDVLRVRHKDPAPPRVRPSTMTLD